MTRPRHLIAWESPAARSALILRFPPGLTLEEAFGDGIRYRHGRPVLPPDAVARLEKAGARVLASGMDPAMASRALDFLPTCASGRPDVEAHVRDYLDANTRLGPQRLVSVREYAMDSAVASQASHGVRFPLHVAMREILVVSAGVAMVGIVGFAMGDARAAPLSWASGALADLAREGLCLRIIDAIWMVAYMAWSVPCLLHATSCEVRRGSWSPDDIENAVPDALRVARVPVLPYDRAREIARRALEAVPPRAWRRAPSATHAMAPLAAFAFAETCEDYRMLMQALQTCRSPCEVVERARSRDAAWEVGRALEAARSG